MIHLRKMMLEELERRNYSQGTIRYYLRFVERFGTSPDSLVLNICAAIRPTCLSSESHPRIRQAPRGRTAILLLAHPASARVPPVPDLSQGATEAGAGTLRGNVRRRLGVVTQISLLLFNHGESIAIPTNVYSVRVFGLLLNGQQLGDGCTVEQTSRSG